MNKHSLFIGAFTTLCLVLSTSGLMIRFEELAKNHDSSSRPKASTLVNVSLHIEALEIDDARQVLKMNGELCLEWDDIRLRFSSVANHQTSIGLEGKRGDRIKHHLWLPDLTIANGLHATSGIARDFLKVSNEGHMTWIQQVFYEFPCKFDYAHYPLGKQECKLSIQSLGYDNSELDIRWRGDDALEHKNALVSLSYKIKKVELSEPSVATLHRAKRQLQAKLELENVSGWAVKRSVLPFVAAVATAYLAFFINVNGITARMMICGTSLIMASIVNEFTFSKTPEVPYTMALEVFTGTCTTFIWLALAECVAADVLLHLHAKGNAFAGEHSEILEDESSNRGQVAALWLDRCCRVLYPALFLAFNAVFWIIYH